MPTTTSSSTLLFVEQVRGRIDRLFFVLTGGGRTSGGHASTRPVDSGARTKLWLSGG